MYNCLHNFGLGYNEKIRRDLSGWPLFVQFSGFEEIAAIRFFAFNCLFDAVGLTVERVIRYY